MLILLAIGVNAAAQNIGGIGAQLFLDTAGGHTMPRIQGLVANTPADTFLKATDFIFKVNGMGCLDKPLEEIVALIRGEAGTRVNIIVTDTKDGKRPREYNLLRKGMQLAGQPPADPVTAFNARCEQEVQRLKAKGSTVIKTFSSGCGDRYFNFEAEVKTYHIRVLWLADTAGANTPFTARVFDNDNEAAVTVLNKTSKALAAPNMIAEAEGDVPFKKSCIGVVNVQAPADGVKCHALYVIVYR